MNYSKSVFFILLPVPVWAAILFCVNVAYPHTGDKIYLIHEITDADLTQLDFADGTLSDWPTIVGPPTTTRADFTDIALFDGIEISSDLDFKFWLGWNNTHSRLYVAIERLDDVYLNSYTGMDADSIERLDYIGGIETDVEQIWFHDSYEFMVDGDHSGGDYGFFRDCCESGEAWRRLQNNQAQQYYVLAESPDQHILTSQSPGPWVHHSPFAAAGSALLAGSPNRILTEFYVTPFDSLAWDQPEASKKSTLSENRIIGFNIAVPDFDFSFAPREYTHYYTLSLEASTWRTADRFVDGLLVRNSKTNVENSTWARIKAAFSGR